MLSFNCNVSELWNIAAWGEVKNHYLTALMTVFSADGKSSADMSQWQPFSSKPSSTPTLASPVTNTMKKTKYKHLKEKRVSQKGESMWKSSSNSKNWEKWKSNKQEKGKEDLIKTTSESNIRWKNSTFANEYKLTK